MLYSIVLSLLGRGIYIKSVARPLYYSYIIGYILMLTLSKHGKIFLWDTEKLPAGQIYQLKKFAVYFVSELKYV